MKVVYGRPTHFQELLVGDVSLPVDSLSLVVGGASGVGRAGLPVSECGCQ